MVMRRVNPGTIQRSQSTPRQNLEKLYEDQQRDIDIAKRNRRGEIGPYGPSGLSPSRENDAGKFAQPKLKDVLPRSESEREDIKRQNFPRGQKEDISSRSDNLPDFRGPRPEGYWGKDASWSQLSDYQKAAAIALLEADSKGGKVDIVAAKNALGAMINRADKEGQELGKHVSGKIYQPTIEPEQYARLQHITRLPAFRDLTDIAEQRATGQIDDWVGGATHFLAKPQVMLDLESKDPAKYKSWRKWTGFDESTGRYKNEVLADSSHVFLAPEGKHSAFTRGPSAFDYGTTAELSRPDQLQVPFPEEQPSPVAPNKVPELPKLSDFLAKPGVPKAQPNDLMDFQSKPITLAGLGGELPDQDDKAFAILPSQQRRLPGGGAPTLPVPRRPPGFAREF